MKSVAVLMLMFGLSFTQAMAQDKPKEDGDRKEMKDMTPEERAEKRTQKMVETLGLTSAQEEKISAINLAHAMEMEKIHQEMKALREKAKDARDKTKSEIDAVLTQEQKDKMNAEMEKRKEEHEKKRKEKCCHDKE